MKRRVVTWQTWTPATVSHFARAPWSPFGWRIINYGSIDLHLRYVLQQWFSDVKVSNFLAMNGVSEEVK